MEKYLKSILDRSPFLSNLLVVVVFGGFAYVIYRVTVDTNELNQNSRYTIARIIRTFYRVGPSSSHDCEFVYEVNGQRYNGTDRYHVEDENQATFLIRFAATNPRNCELLSDYPVYDATLTAPAAGWTQIPNSIFSLKKPNTWEDILLMIVVYSFIAFLVGGIFLSLVRSILLRLSHRFAVATIGEIKTHKTQDDGDKYLVSYNFHVNERAYRRNAITQMHPDLSTGKHYWVKFHPKYPSNSELLADKPVEPIPAELPPNGWEKIPA